MLARRLTALDFALVAVAALALLGLERGHRLEIEAPERAEMSAKSCQDELENRRFVARRMMIADGSIPVVSAWRNERLAAECRD
jgi:hypothetical protein